MEKNDRIHCALSLITMIVSGDGLLKKFAERGLAGEPPKKLCGGRVCLNLFHNDGAALGALQDNQKLLLAIHSAVVGASAVELYNALTERKKTSTAGLVGLTLLVGGGLSNLLDRVQRGYVTDYVSFNFGKRFAKLRRVVFNCSDFCVLAGCICWVLQHTSKSKQ